jgi:putative Mg2+ transporter-C (MgtC) family protein
MNWNTLVGNWSADWQFLGGVALAMVLGSLIGLEREFAGKPAGLRTHMLLCGAAALLTEVGLAMVHQSIAAPNPSLRADPVVIVQAVATAVGFIGGGTILRHPETDHVEGLTTAASLLLTSAIGMAAASSRAILAIGATLLALVVLRGVRWAEVKIGKRKPRLH